MSVESLLRVTPRTDAAHRLQQALVAYCHFRTDKPGHPQAGQLPALCSWQIDRLKTTHRDLYEDPAYHTALDFLVNELYAPQDFSRRDEDLDRLFPKMVKLLPDHVLDLVADLVELNHLTQKLDLDLLDSMAALGETTLTPGSYARAYAACNNRPLRTEQLRLIKVAGATLERYVHSHFLRWTLKATRGAAERAGLGELHHFLERGFEAFATLDDVPALLDRLQRRETAIMETLFSQQADEDWPQSLAGDAYPSTTPAPVCRPDGDEQTAQSSL